MANGCVLNFLNFLNGYMFFFKDLCHRIAPHLRPMCLRARFFMLINIKFRSTSLGLMFKNISLEVTGSKPTRCRDVSPLAKSQVIGISGLHDVGYTIGRLLFSWLEKKLGSKRYLNKLS